MDGLRFTGLLGMEINKSHQVSEAPVEKITTRSGNIWFDGANDENNSKLKMEAKKKVACASKTTSGSKVRSIASLRWRLCKRSGYQDMQTQRSGVPTEVFAKHCLHHHG